MNYRKYLPFICTIMSFGLWLNRTYIVAQPIKWYASTAQQPWMEQRSVNFEKRSAGDTGFLVDKEKPLQKITGWGGCFNEIGGKALTSLDEIDRVALMKELFDPKSGCRFNICRTPMAASDFALNAYSYDDVEGDYGQKFFSINRDKQYLIPYIKSALTQNTKLLLWASPWSPPAWMKTSGKYYGGSLRMDDSTLESYAHYQALYVKEYAKLGIHIAQIHPQNEPAVSSKYPSCVWKQGDSMNHFIKRFLAPVFKKEKVAAQIWLGTITSSDTNWFKGVLEDKVTRGYLSGIGVQYESRKILPFIKRYGLPMMETETRCYNGANTWKEAEDTYGLMLTYLYGGCQAYMFWNIILDETGLSSWAWKQNCSINIDTKKRAITYNPQFYLMKHFSHFVDAGAVLLNGKVSDDAISFKNPDGKLVMVVINKGNDKSFVALVGDKKLTVSLAAHSFNTFVFPKTIK